MSLGAHLLSIFVPSHFLTATKYIYKALIKLAQMRLITVVVNVNMRDNSILVQIPGNHNRFKKLNDKKKEKDGDK